MGLNAESHEISITMETIMKTNVISSLILAAALSLTIAPAFAQPQALVIADPQIPGYSSEVAQNVAAALVSAGYTVKTEPISAFDSISAGKEPCDLLAIANARTLPLSTAPPIEAYLAHGGRAIFLNAPAWTDAALKLKDGRWLTPAQLETARESLAAEPVLFDFSQPNAASAWWVSTGPVGAPAQMAVEKADSEQAFGADLHVIESDFRTWSTFHPRTAFTDSPFGQDKTLTVFWAHGDARTTSIAIEWDERNGSRWIATVPITRSWRRYALSPDRFTPWQNPPDIERQGFHPSAAAGFSFGLSKSHTDSSDGKHEYWVAQIGVAADVATAVGATPRPIAMDGLWPAYKVFPIHGKVNLTVGEPSPGALSSPHARPSGLGILKDRRWRWQSIVSASDASTGQWRGSPVTRIVHAQTAPDFAGAIYEAYCVSDPAYYTRPATLALIRQFASRVADGRFLLEGGADAFTYFDGDPVTLGATLVDIRQAGSDAPAHATVDVSVTDPAGKTVFAKTWPVTMEPGSQQTFTSSWQPAAWPSQGFTVSTRLIEEGRTIDSIAHKIYAWKPAVRPDFITIRPDGHFWLDGKPWRVNGINYMPSSGIGVENGKFFEHWLDKPSYDPVIIHRDLAHIANLGFNAISVFIYVSDIPSRNLLDLLRQARDLGLHVNLALRPGMPSSFVAADILKILTAYRLPENDTVFAYDIAWEPSFGNHKERMRMDPDWRAWLTQKYGDEQKAEGVWGVAGPKNGSGELTNPSDEQIAKASGPVASMVEDYRRFLDDWEQKAYSEPAAVLHQADPHHAVSFRMSNAGAPAVGQSPSLPYQFAGLGRAVDFLSPEGYGLPDGPNGLLAGCFEIALGRSAAPKEPILWAECGKQVWGSADRLIAQADYYRMMYDICIKSGADGLIFWWYPGGFRVGENSDFGLVDPDGADRPATKVVREKSATFLNAPLASAPDSYLQYDPYAYPDGPVGIYRDLGPKIRALEAAGHRVGLKAVEAPRK